MSATARRRIQGPWYISGIRGEESGTRQRQVIPRTSRQSTEATRKPVAWPATIGHID